MTDSVVKQFSQEVAQVTSEVVRDVKDAVGEMIEQGVQSAVGQQLTPYQIQQKQLEEQKQLQEARRKIAFLKRIDQEQKTVREANKQKETQRLQAQQQNQTVKEQQAVTQQTSKKPGQLPEEVLRTQVEFKPGKGVGG